MLDDSEKANLIEVLQRENDMFKGETYVLVESLKNEVMKVSQLMSAISGLEKEKATLLVEKANLEAQNAQNRKEQNALYEQIFALNNKIEHNQLIIDQQESMKEELARKIASQKKSLDIAQINIDEIERRYQKQLLELATITAKANAAEKDRIEVQAKF